MTRFLALIFITLSICSCRNTEQEEEIPAVNEEQLEEVAFTSYGQNITMDNAKESNDLALLYASLKSPDTVEIKVRTQITEVCAKKGCWIEIPAGDDQMARVTFKDYGFILPKNSQGKEVVLQGKAFKSTTSIADLKHYAMDAGKSQQEIDAIINDKVTLGFIATGALVETFENADVFVAASETSK